MARTPSTMPDLGAPAAPFALPDAVTGRTVSLDTLPAGAPLLVMFICNHCPFVKHIAAELARIGRDFQPRGLAIVAINSNDIANYPDDSPERMKEEAAAQEYTFGYLFDESQEVARAYRAACTPDFFLYDARRRLVYRGQLDASRPGNGIPVTGSDLRAAIDTVLAGGTPSPQQTPSIGCNIKWKAGNEPDYFTELPRS